MTRLGEHGWRPVGVDLVVAAARPVVASRRDELVTRIADLLRVQPDAVSIKGTTSDGLGFSRRGRNRRLGSRGRRANRMTEWIGGRRPVAEALAAGREAHRLILSATAKPAPELRAITDAARRIRLPIDRVPADQMTRIAGFDGHQGVLLEVGERRWTEVGEMLAHAREGGRDPFILVLEHLQDPDQLRDAPAVGRGRRRGRRRLP